VKLADLITQIRYLLGEPEGMFTDKKIELHLNEVSETIRHSKCSYSIKELTLKRLRQELGCGQGI